MHEAIVEVHIPGELLQFGIHPQAIQQHLVEWLVLSLFKDERVSSGKAAKLLGISRLESPLYARLALKGIHDPDGLGARVVLEVAGALAGVVIGWQWFRKKSVDGTTRNGAEKTDP